LIIGVEPLQYLPLFFPWRINSVITTGNEKTDQQIRKLYDMGQDHVFRFWDDLSETEREALLDDIMSMDLPLMERLISDHIHGETAQADEEISLEPCSVIDREGDEKRGQAEERGEECLHRGETAAFLVAGGQGTRLGFDGPKGSFPIGPVSQRSLFRIHAEKILAASQRYGVTIPWYIMTSKGNHKDTVSFFEKHSFFGMDCENIMFFSQAMIPAVDPDGRFFLSSKCSIFKNPNGHGGSLEALHTSGALADMKERGIEYISYFQVDNPLVRVIDPVFLGFHMLNNAEMSSKTVEKRDPEEKVGIVGYMNGRLGVIEYSDFPEEQKHKKNADGFLVYSAGSIAVHILNRTFAEEENREGFRLPYHKAEKRVPHIGEDGSLVEPEGKNGIKFETFVFDALRDTKASVTLRTRREDEFSPVKNSSGSDSPDTARKDMSRLYRRWLAEAGMKGDLPDTVEISPLFADTGAELKRKLNRHILSK